MEDKDISFSGNDPGAAKYGNFINYYSFHSPSQRLKNLNPKMFPTEENSTLICLDIGCNAGVLTKALKDYLEKLYPDLTVKMLAIDIDHTLIERAKELNSENADIDYVALDIMSDTGCETIKKYINDYGKEYFDFIFCFSVTMWIHLNHGDDGLIKFLEFIETIAKTIIIEPQPWRCYRNAKRRMSRAGKHFSLFPTLKIKSGVDLVIENILTERTHRKIYASPLSAWKRKVLSLRLVDP